MSFIPANKPLISRISQLLLMAVTALTAAGVNSQVLPDFVTTRNANANAPVAFVYVAEPNSILGYAVAADGTLAPVPGSPFSASVYGLAVNGKYLFGSKFDGIHVDAYRIQSNGSLTFSKSTDINQYNNGTTCPNLQASPLVLDHTGATLYTVAYQGDVCASTSYKSFAVNKATGGLNYLSDSGTRPVWNFPLQFSSNNEYAYGAECIGGLTTPYWADAFGVLKRSSNGKLTYINAEAPLPATKNNSYFYCRSHTAADPKDNLVVGVYQLEPIATDLYNQGSMLANYKIENSGSLATKSKYNNMPWTTKVGELEDLQMSPSGKFLAVAGGRGLEVWHANGGNAPSHYTGLLTSDLIGQTFWDNANHLYAISLYGRLHVFTITEEGYAEAPGSPHAVPAGGFAIPIIVQPLTRM